MKSFCDFAIGALSVLVLVELAFTRKDAACRTRLATRSCKVQLSLPD